MDMLEIKLTYKELYGALNTITDMGSMDACDRVCDFKRYLEDNLEDLIDEMLEHAARDFVLEKY